MGNPRIVGPDLVASPDTVISCIFNDTELIGQWKYHLEPPVPPGYETPPGTDEIIPISLANCSNWTWTVNSAPTGTGFSATAGGPIYTNGLANVNPVYFKATEAGEYTITLQAESDLFPQPQDNILHVTVLKVDLDAAYSDQIPSRECNALPGQDPMYMGARADNRGYLQIDATVLPQQINNIGMVGVRHGTSILTSEPIQTPRTPIDYAPAGGRELYEVVAGCDLNADGTLQNSEASEVITDQLMLLTQGDYSWSRGVLNNYAIITIGVGSQLLEAFIDNTIPPNVVNTATTIASTELTHPVGASWDAGCSAATRLYTYVEGTDVSDAVEEDSHTIAALQTNLGQHQAEVQNYFTQNPTNNEHTFGPWNWQSNGLDFDGVALQFAFGHVNVAGAVSVTVRRSDLAVTNISYTGSFTDVYDFNYTGAYPSEHGATMQSGFPSLGVGGRVFRDRVEFSRDTTNFSYDFN